MKLASPRNAFKALPQCEAGNGKTRSPDVKSLPVFQRGWTRFRESSACYFQLLKKAWPGVKSAQALYYYRAKVDKEREFNKVPNLSAGLKPSAKRMNPFGLKLENIYLALRAKCSYISYIKIIFFF